MKSLWTVLAALTTLTTLSASAHAQESVIFAVEKTFVGNSFRHLQDSSQQKQELQEQCREYKKNVVKALKNNYLLEENCKTQIKQSYDIDFGFSYQTKVHFKISVLSK